MSVLNGVIRKKDFDLLTSSELDPKLRSLKIYWIVSNYSVKFYKGLISSFLVIQTDTCEDIISLAEAIKNA